MGTKRRTWATAMAALTLFCAWGAGCKGPRNTRPYHEPPPPEIKPTTLHYVETAGFDSLFETSLVNEDPVILVQTDTPRPDWGPRLNAWVAAWNRGGKVEGAAGRTVRPQAPVTVNGETIREFRLLVDDLMGKAERLAREGTSWWAEERVRTRRVALLRPYNLRFHLDADQNIQLIFFNGKYPDYYRDFTASLAAVSDEEEPGRWSRIVTCSHCRRQRRGAGSPDVVIELSKAGRDGP